MPPSTLRTSSMSTATCSAPRRLPSSEVVSDAEPVGADVGFVDVDEPAAARRREHPVGARHRQADRAAAEKAGDGPVGGDGLRHHPALVRPGVAVAVAARIGRGGEHGGVARELLPVVAVCRERSVSVWMRSAAASVAQHADQTRDHGRDEREREREPAQRRLIGRRSAVADAAHGVDQAGALRPRRACGAGSRCRRRGSWSRHRSRSPRSARRSWSGRARCPGCGPAAPAGRTRSSTASSSSLSHQARRAAGSIRRPPTRSARPFAASSARGRRPPQQRTQPGQQLVELERLGQVVVGARRRGPRPGRRSPRGR